MRRAAPLGGTVRSILIVALLAAASLAPAYAQKSGPYKMNEEGVKAPVLVSEVKPKYTDDAKARRVQGNVELDVVVKSDGTVGDVTVTKSLDPDLDEQAVKATKQWRFRPGSKDSKPVDVMVQIELTFTLK
jgi:TonB family protein